MNSYFIRTTIRLTDLSQIVLFHATYYHELYGWNEEFEAYVAKPLAEFVLARDPGERIWIVESGGEVKGAVALVKADADTAQLRWFYVEQELRGRGIGSELITLLLEFAAGAGYRQVILWTASNLLEAISLYKKHGFSLVEEEEHLAWGKQVTEQKWVKKVTA
jgi:ribosomal protein S18 acetylase RimI-like enzyme